MKSEKKEISSRVCLWLEKGICHIGNDTSCPVDCDLKSLRFDKDSIVARMREEEKNIYELKRAGMFKNREKIKDKIGGIYVMQKVLKNHFDYRKEVFPLQ
jgi:hypothetical protein